MILAANAVSVGTSIPRIDGPLKVTGMARYAYEHPVANPVHLYPLVAPIARGTIKHIDAVAALAVPGVLLVLTHQNAPKLWIKTDAPLVLLQSAGVALPDVMKELDRRTSQSGLEEKASR